MITRAVIQIVLGWLLWRIVPSISPKAKEKRALASNCAATLQASFSWC